jgi:CheY-like chemotaxis protein
MEQSTNRVRSPAMNASRNVSDEPVPAPPPTILVVEDEILVRTVIAAYLRDCGFDVVEAGNADEAVRVLEAGIRIDIVFSDVNMPGSLDGFGPAQWLRRERPRLKIILTSGAAQGGEGRERPLRARPDPGQALRLRRTGAPASGSAVEKRLTPRRREAPSRSRGVTPAVVGHRPRPLPTPSRRRAPHGSSG